MSTTAKDLYLGNDFEAEVVIDQKNAGTGKGERATGLTGLTYWLSATDGGTAIHATLSKSLAERSTAVGTYSAVIDAADIDAQLTAYAEQTVYGVCTKGGDVKASQPIRVHTVRRPA